MMAFDFERPKPSLKAFEYGSLGTVNIASRLVLLQHAPERDSSGRVPAIRCKLKPLYVGGGGEEYDAVSYVWGNAQRDRPIELSNAIFHVSSVVEDILLRLRHENVDRLIWIDLICIDQSNYEERNRQVACMKDIFENARTVIVSLGPHGLGLSRWETPRARDAWQKRQEDMQRAMDVLVSKSLVIRSFVKRPLSNDHEECLRVFLSHEWFERIWVVQEVALAKNLVILCGDKRIDGKALFKLDADNLNRTRAPELKAKIRQLQPLLQYMAGEFPTHYQNSKPELLTLLQEFRGRKASLPHDMVYALLGLSIDGPDSPVLKPDYSRSAASVYQDVVRHTIARYGSLAVLTYAFQPSLEISDTYGGRTNSQDERMAQRSQIPVLELPSWCSDWRVRDRLVRPPEFPFLWHTNREATFTKNPLPKTIERLSAQYSMSNSKKGTLMLPGYTIATIAAIMDGNVAVSVTEASKIRISNLASTCTKISAELSRMNQQLQKANASTFQPGDHIAFLCGASGIAVLRPRDGQYELVFLDHSQFVIIREWDFAAHELVRMPGWEFSAQKLPAWAIDMSARRIIPNQNKGPDSPVFRHLLQEILGKRLQEPALFQLI